mgnify:CR=1 FL=1
MPPAPSEAGPSILAILAGSGDALVLGVTGDGTRNPYSDFDQARMSILASGNVGIGTTAPLVRLHVIGDIAGDWQCLCG